MITTTKNIDSTCHLPRYSQTTKKSKMRLNPINHRHECVECQTHTYIKARSIELEFIKNDIVDLWTSTRDAPIKNPEGLAVIGGGGYERYLVSDGYTTMVPSYHSYSQLWARTMTVNPFDYKWSEFKICDQFDRDYIGLVAAVLDEQLMLWTGGCPIAGDLRVVQRIREFSIKLWSIIGYMEEYFKGNRG